MKSLTLLRPWDQLILAGIKPVENRVWKSPYRGPVALIAGLGYDPHALLLAKNLGVDLSRVDLTRSSPTGLTGIVTLGSICSAARIFGLCDCGPWAFPGQHHWRVDQPTALTAPIPAKGHLGLRTVTPELLAALRAAGVAT